MSIKVIELGDKDVAYILSGLVELKRVYRNEGCDEECEDIEKMLQALQRVKLYAGGVIN